MRFLAPSCIIALCIFCFSTPVGASFVYNTGVLGFSDTLSANSVDANYTVSVGENVAVAMSSPEHAAIVQSFSNPFGNNGSDDRFSLRPRAAGDGISSWVAAGNLANPSVENYYVYATKFDLTGFDSNTAVITGRFATNGTYIDILLNGTSLGSLLESSSSITRDGNTVWTNLPPISSSFNAGLNSLQFVTRGGPGAGIKSTGFRAELSGFARSSVVIPEPTSVLLFAWGVPALAILRRRKTA